MEFLTTALIGLPESMSESERLALVAAEGIRARELIASGELVRVWRTPGPWGNICLWNVPHRQALQRALETLPLFPHMSISIQELEQHPNDSGGR